MKIINILLVGATKDSSVKSIYWYDIANNYTEYINDNIIKVTVLPFLNNTTGLSTIYNKVLDEHRHNYDYIIFMHDDTLFVNFKLFLREVLSTKSDLMGVAGATAFPKYGLSPMAWNTNAAHAQAGEVWHKAKPDMPLIKQVFANTPKTDKALTVDGLCLIFAKSALDDINLKFDETFSFDFYDMDLCFTATKLGKRISVIHAPIIHYSLGFGIHSDRYKQLETIFRKKWNVQNEIVSYDYDKWVSVIMTNS